MLFIRSVLTTRSVELTRCLDANGVLSLSASGSDVDRSAGVNKLAGLLLAAYHAIRKRKQIM